MITWELGREGSKSSGKTGDVIYEWPLYKNKYFFQLVGKAESCEILQLSLERFYARAFPGQISSRSAKSICTEDGTCSNHFGGVLTQVNITFTRRNGCEDYPHEKMDESCEIKFSLK